MNQTRTVARWVIAGAGVLVLSGAGIASATTPPSEPPGDTAMAVDTAAGGASSEPMAGGAGPSNCPAVGAMAPATSAAPAGTDMVDATTADTAMTADTATDGTAAAGEAMAATTEAAMGTEAPSDTGAAAAGGAFVQIAESEEYGPILVDAECRSLYIFANDADGEPTCADDCATNWPPLFVDGDAVPALADELDAALFSVVEHAEGAMLKVGDWPLYYFAGDVAPGDTNGQGVGGVWWLVGPDGTPYEEATEGTAPADTGMAGTAPADTGMATETTGG